MSEYQYYAFRALDRPLDAAARAELRTISSRAAITAASFVNHYEWGDFKGDVDAFMDRWFDLHLYYANWGVRRLVVKVPARLVDRPRLAAALAGHDAARLRQAGESLIIDIIRQEAPDEDVSGEDEPDWLADIEPARAGLVGGDLRMLYLVWLIAAEDGALDPDALEPLPGLGKLTPSLGAVARFLVIDRDLLAAACEQDPTPTAAPAKDDASPQQAIEALPEAEKTALLLRLHAGDPHVGAELRARLRAEAETAEVVTRPPRSLRMLKLRAAALTAEREQRRAEAEAAERHRRVAEAAQHQARRVAVLRSRGPQAWQAVDAEIARRNPKGYDAALALLLDLQALAREDGTVADFDRRIAVLRADHASKSRFLERLDAAGLG